MLEVPELREDSAQAISASSPWKIAMSPGFEGVPDEAWAEMVDPVGFVVGSILILFYRPKRGGSAATTGENFAYGTRLVGTAVVAGVVALPIVLGVWFPDVSTGDQLWYAATLLVAGLFTFVPGRVAELRDRQLIRGSGYPKTLRIVMWWLEYCLGVALLVAVVTNFWKFGASHQHARAVAWGLFAVFAADWYTVFEVRYIAASRPRPVEPAPERVSPPA